MFHTAPKKGKSMLCLFKISNPNNLILVIITFTFIPLVGVAVFFLELLLLKEVLKHQVNCDIVQWVASCRSEELNVCVRLRVCVCVCVRVFLHRYSNSIRIVEAEYWYSYSYSVILEKPNSIRIRIRSFLKSRIVFVFVFGHF